MCVSASFVAVSTGRVHLSDLLAAVFLRLRQVPEIAPTQLHKLQNPRNFFLQPIGIVFDPDCAAQVHCCPHMIGDSLPSCRHLDLVLGGLWSIFQTCENTKEPFLDIVDTVRPSEALVMSTVTIPQLNAMHRRHAPHSTTPGIFTRDDRACCR